MSRPTLILYGRAGCHLCADMQDELQPFLARHGAELRIVDVDQDASLSERFGLRVPVLVLDGHEICQYFLDPQALESTLNGKVS